MDDGLGWHASGDHAQEAFEHFAEGLDQKRGLVGDELGEFRRVDGVYDELGLELDLSDDVGDEGDHRP